MTIPERLAELRGDTYRWEEIWTVELLAEKLDAGMNHGEFEWLRLKQVLESCLIPAHLLESASASGSFRPL